jgi:hypothetical protein
VAFTMPFVEYKFIKIPTGILLASKFEFSLKEEF